MTASIDTLRQQLAYETEFLTQLDSVLDNEKLALQHRDSEAIIGLAEQKKSLIARLQSEALKRAQALVALGKPQDESALLFIRRISNQDMQNAWIGANDLVARCLHKNEVNGRIISHSQQRLAKVTAIIRGQSGAPQLYGQKGKQTALGQSVRIASA